MMHEEHFFKSVSDHFPVFQTRYDRQDSSDYIYHGVIVKHNRISFIYKHGMGVVDLLSSLGGLFALMWQVLEPIPLFISTIKFELGVMSLLFTAKSFKKKEDHN